MSIQSWCDEFFDVDLEDVPDTNEAAAAHGAKKWAGVRQANLEKHGVVQNGCSIVNPTDTEEDPVSLTGNTCKLCQMYAGCNDCPVEDSGNGCDEKNSPWRAAVSKKEPERLIQLLTQIAEGKL